MGQDSSEHDKRKDQNKKGDMTGILDMGPLESSDLSSTVPGTESSNDTEIPIEKIDDFASLSDLGMVDHAPDQTFSGMPPGAAPDHTDMTTMSEPPRTSHEGFESLEQSTVITPTIPIEAFDSSSSLDSMDKIKEYSEASLPLSNEVEINYAFHFYADGQFGYFERDKLLRFITENPVGITSSDIDVQINAGRVFIPRISEYAAIKLVQELRDTPLTLRIRPSERDSEDLHATDPITQIQYHTASSEAPRGPGAIQVIDPKSADRDAYEAYDQMQASQFLKAEMVEVEKSELFQEVLARMIESLKNKARLKGAEAITRPETQLIPLRLPSQYQIVLTTALLKRKVNA